MEDQGGSDWHKGLGRPVKEDAGHKVLGRTQEEIDEINKKNDPSVLGKGVKSKEKKHYGLGQNSS